jgi:polyisoprenoid-binding protein YceI
MASRRRTRFRIVPDRSTVRIGARSTMGPIAFETQSVTGSIDAAIVAGDVVAEPGPSGALEVCVDELRSGNELFDAELRRRVNAAAFPTCRVDLTRARLLGGHRFALAGELTFHEVTRAVEGSVEVEAPDEGTLLVVGEKRIDMRDFGLPTPGVMLLKIYPDVRVQMFLEARAEADEMTTEETM